MGIFDFLKKKETEEVSTKSPDLMAADPASGSSVDLMASDPINTVLENPVMQQAPEIIEQPGIEDQLVKENPVVYKATNSIESKEEAPIAQINPAVDAFESKEEAPVTQINPTTDAFAMPLPDAPEPVTENPTPVNDVSNKFCSECGTPSDALSKFCVSCGKALE